MKRGVYKLAFVSMILAFLFVFIIILVAVFLLGAIITVISVIKRKKARNKGEKPKRAGLIFGIIIMLLPIFTVLGIGLLFAFGDNGTNSYDTAKEYRDILVSGLENNDADMIYSAFSSDTRKADSSLSSEINEMLEYIDGNVTDCDVPLPSEYCEKYDEKGMYEIMMFNGKIGNIKTDKNKEYHIMYYGRSMDDESPDKIGIDTVMLYYGDGYISVGLDRE